MKPKAIPAKALITEALIYLDVEWTGPQIRTALIVADCMFGTKRAASVSQATIAARQRCHETRVYENLKALSRRPGEPHVLARHAFIKTYRSVPWEGGGRGGRKVTVLTLAPELEAAVLAVRSRPKVPTETSACQGNQSATETPESRGFNGPTETSEGQGLRSLREGPTETPEIGDRNPGTGGAESGKESGNGNRQSLRAVVGRLSQATSLDRLKERAQ